MTHQLIQKLGSLGPITEEESRVLLAALGPVRTIAANQDMVLEGSQPTESTVLINGFAARYKIGTEGLRPITALHVPGDFVDLHSYLLNRMDHSVVALSECQIAGVAHGALDETAASQGVVSFRSAG